MALTYTDMLLVYPEFLSEDTTDQTMITTWITVAENSVGPTQFGDIRNTVVLTLAAHYIALGTRRNNESASGGAGAVTAKTTGESIISFSVQTKGDGYDVYRTTSYGQMYLNFLFALDLTPLVT